MRSVGLAAVMAAFVSACAGQSQNPGVPDLPANYRAMVAERVKSTFFDPYSVRDAGIAAPIAGTSMMGPTQTVCVRANARNRMGGYTGAQATAFIFRAGVITTTADRDISALACVGAVYEPFPEIDSATQQQPAVGGNPKRR